MKLEPPDRRCLLSSDHPFLFYSLHSLHSVSSELSVTGGAVPPRQKLPLHFLHRPPRSLR
uniref:Uncharacterized protein n=1 Tax=Arundo donax TaxID=35708 RepID=A0A0A9SHS8_ARUDO